MFSKKDSDSFAITDEKVIQRFTSNPDFPYLISFPRTGSHWLRMLMELYFEKPSLVRSFYYKNPKDFTCYHHHDEELTVERRNVIYLFRDPVPTVFSQMNYYNNDLSDKQKIAHWSDLYGRHLNKWLIAERFTTKKTVLRYENMKNDINTEFAKICDHFGLPFDAQRLATVSKEVSKEKLKEKTKHDNQVVNLSSDYDSERKNFHKKNEALIMDAVFSVAPGVKSYF